VRILHITKRYWPFRGGVERYVEDLAHGQAARGHDVTVLTIDRDVLGATDVRLPRDEEQGTVHVRRARAAGGQRKQFLIEPPGRVIRLLRDADVVHHHDPRFLFELAVATRRMIGKPIVVHTHGLILHTEDFARLKSIMLRVYYGPIFGHLVDAMIADSESDRQILVGACHVPDDRIRLFLNALDLRAFQQVERRPEPGRLLMFGRIDAHKGHADLLRALAHVAGPWELDVLGAGPESLVAEHQTLAADLGLEDRVRWHGEVDDDVLKSMLSRAWLVCFPSRFEGFGLALVEAMAAGCNVLVSDLPSHREILGEGLADLIIDFQGGDTSDRLAAEIGAQADTVMSRAGLVRARSMRFSIDRLVDEFEDYYRGFRGDPAG
jgi:alpha-1,3-mannosyltransferase